MFIRFQMASCAATLTDFAVTIFLKEICGFWYMVSTSTGSLLGGITNFSLGRRWVFQVTETSTRKQATRYLMGWTGSILLNIAGVFLLTHFGKLNYLYSKIITSFLVGIFFNYFMQKKFVFSRPACPPELYSTEKS
ncbi:MAG: GtrA family protein [Syntrophothermus sp.]